MKNSITLLLTCLALIGCVDTTEECYYAEAEPGKLLSITSTTAKLQRGNQIMNLHVDRLGNKLAMYQAYPSSAFVFTIVDGGKSLECNDCEWMSIPKVWLRRDNLSLK